ncbi:hypothetical protein B0H11DRAFT_2187045 [Mycena galericulata]|nr:hypothetical protein B0H11DRAFT_2187045 [Mycena galericulata]
MSTVARIVLIGGPVLILASSISSYPLLHGPSSRCVVLIFDLEAQTGTLEYIVVGIKRCSSSFLAPGVSTPQIVTIRGKEFEIHDGVVRLAGCGKKGQGYTEGSVPFSISGYPDPFHPNLNLDCSDVLPGTQTRPTKHPACEALGRLLNILTMDVAQPGVAEKKTWTLNRSFASLTHTEEDELLAFIIAKFLYGLHQSHEFSPDR